MLRTKLEMTIWKFNQLIKKKADDTTQTAQPTDVKRFKYAFTKTSLDETIVDLEAWQRTFDPSWFLIMRVSKPSIDRELEQNRLAIWPSVGGTNLRCAIQNKVVDNSSVFLPREGISAIQTNDIKYSTARCIQRPDSAKWFMLDRVPYNSVLDRSIVEGNIRSLARRLMFVEPFTFGILQCRGVVRILDERSAALSSFDFAFKIPESLVADGATLRYLLQDELNLTLSARFELAKTLGKAISYIHTIDFVHKNIRPDTIFAFKNKDNEESSFFLGGFQESRTADGQTVYAGELSWEKNLYRHPRRQGLNPEDRFIMQHDIYSLGVCLLEIGLWKSFVNYDEDCDPVPGPGLDSAGPIPLKDAGRVKQEFTRLAEQELPRTMGERYTQIVVNCLTCLDPDNVDFGDHQEFEDQDGILVGVKYIEKVHFLNFNGPQTGCTNHNIHSRSS